MARPIFTNRRPAAKVVTWLATLSAVGALLMAAAHSGLELPVASSLGPTSAVPAAAAGFLVGSAFFVVVGLLAWSQLRSAWSFGLVVNALALMSALVPFRGPISAAAAVVSVAAIAVLLSPSGREAFGRST